MPLGIQLALAALAGAALGFLFGWLLGRGRGGAENLLRQQLAQRETELNQARTETGQLKSALATAQANQASAEKLLAEQRALHERTLADARAAQEKALADLRETFKALSADA